jgi:hypothetical protein
VDHPGSHRWRAVSLTYEDARRRSTRSHAPRAGCRALAETRREGGLGVILAHGLTASADYAYVFGRNRIRLTLRGDAKPS